MIRQIVQISKTTFTDGQRRAILLFIGVVLSGACIWLLTIYIGQAVLSDMRKQGESRAGFYSQSLRSNLEKFRHLPYILSRDNRIRELLMYRIPALRVNPHLEDFGHATGSLIFVMDDGGNVLATSNWRTDQSLMGHNFSFRPYFIVARDGEPGGYFAFGLRTKKPGYFLSYPVLHNGKLLGVVAVKVDLLPLQERWLKGGETIMVSDGHGVVILSSRKEWRYQSLKPLVEKTKNRLRRTQFLELPLESLSLERKAGIRDTLLTIDGERFMEISRQLPEYGWRLHYLQDHGRIRRAMVGSLVASLSFFIIMSLLLLYVRERRQKIISRRLAEEAEKIRSLNVLLQQEVAEHKATARTLRQTQRDLVQAGKLAALGRMSAAVAHELNQPVTAIRMFIASIRKLLDRQQYEKADKTLIMISGLTDRMAALTGQLKTFSRKDSGRGKPMDVNLLVARIAEVMGPQLRAAKVSLIPNYSEQSAMVYGDEVRFEQVLVNLINNSIDAVRNSVPKEIRVKVEVHDEKVFLSVSDSGDGICEESRDYLFEPFFTTKEGGEGLGLGLSISYGIVRDYGGDIQASDVPGGGAEFRITLPVYRMQSGADE